MLQKAGPGTPQVLHAPSKGKYTVPRAQTWKRGGKFWQEPSYPYWYLRWISPRDESWSLEFCLKEKNCRFLFVINNAAKAENLCTLLSYIYCKVFHDFTLFYFVFKLFLLSIRKGPQVKKDRVRGTKFTTKPS